MTPLGNRTLLISLSLPLHSLSIPPLSLNLTSSHLTASHLTHLSTHLSTLAPCRIVCCDPSQDVDSAHPDRDGIRAAEVPLGHV